MKLLLCAHTHTHSNTCTLEPMGGEERSHIRAQPCLIMDLMETVSAQSVSTCAAPDSSQLLHFIYFFFFLLLTRVRSSHAHELPARTFACINNYIEAHKHAPTHAELHTYVRKMHQGADVCGTLLSLSEVKKKKNSAEAAEFNILY